MSGPRSIIGRVVDMGNGRTVIQSPPEPRPSRPVDLNRISQFLRVPANTDQPDPDYIGSVGAADFGFAVGRWPQEVVFRFARSVTVGDEFVGCDYVGPNGQYVRILND